MSRIALEAPHALGRDEALKRLKNKFDSARSQYGSEVQNLAESWTDHTLNFSFSALGMSVSGTVKVEDRSVKLSAQVPLAAKLFQGAIEKHIRAELGTLLA